MIGLLLVDDDRDLLELIGAHLTPEGFEVEIAGGGREALGMYCPERHHVVLSDVRMPGMDGFEFLAHLMAADPGACVVFMTGQPSDEGLLRSIANGTGGYVQKPFDLGYLTALLRQTARRGQVRRAKVQPPAARAVAGTVGSAAVA
jgi:DNA-binding NtrC family response regulator